jgi:hypothetical protein
VNVDVCPLCRINPADRGTECDECHTARRPPKRDRKTERVKAILKVPN